MDEKNIKPGFLLIDKPSGLTSHDVIYRVRKVTQYKRVGHAGTLDPLATGLLIVGVQREATREMSLLVGLDKTYQAEFTLGATSDTDDQDGKITLTNQTIKKEILKKIEPALKDFLGPLEQIPPQYAAIKIKGKKMYELARAGQKIEAPARSIKINRYVLTKPPIINSTGLIIIQVEIDCSSGTYIRSLARDLGEKLGIGGYVSALRRTKIGPFSVNEAIKLEDLKEKWQKNLLKVENILKAVNFEKTLKKDL